MKKADPNCDQCGGKGMIFYNCLFSRGVKDCECYKEEPHRDNPALDEAETLSDIYYRHLFPAKHQEDKYDKTVGKATSEHWKDAYKRVVTELNPDGKSFLERFNFPEEAEPRKPKRKRHILKRKKRGTCSLIEGNVIGIVRTLRSMGY